MMWLFSRAMALAGLVWPLILGTLSVQSFWAGESRWGVAFLFLAWAAFSLAAMADSLGTIKILLAGAGLADAADADALRRVADESERYR